jgi:hypothetical protein
VTNDPQRGFVGELADELRRASRELVGGLRASGRGIAAEGRSVLVDLDAPGPGFWRRGWRGFRRTPLPLQVVVALCLFVLWAVFLFNFFSTPSPAPPQSPTDTGTSV